MRFATNTGANATATLAKNRGTTGSPSSCAGGTSQATAKHANSTAYITAGAGSRMRRAISTAASTANRMPANTSELTNHVVPKRSANWTMLLVSSSRNAAPMQNRSA
jgi:hypothetical protein